MTKTPTLQKNSFKAKRHDAFWQTILQVSTSSHVTIVCLYLIQRATSNKSSECDKDCMFSCDASFPSFIFFWNILHKPFTQDKCCNGESIEYDLLLFHMTFTSDLTNHRGNMQPLLENVTLTRWKAHLALYFHWLVALFQTLINLKGKMRNTTKIQVWNEMNSLSYISQTPPDIVLWIVQFPRKIVSTS